MADPLDACVVGAGLSGLVAARRLRDAGLRVAVIEQGPAPGGRLATRQVGAACMDTGAQFFTIRGSTFARVVDAWRQAGCPIRTWAHGFAQAPDVRDGPRGAVGGDDGYPRYTVDGGMRSLARHLAEDLDVRSRHRIVAIRQQHGRLVLETGVASTPDLETPVVVCTAPVPVTLALVRGLPVPAATRRELDAISYDPCVALAAVLEGSPPLPQPGGVQFSSGPVQWLADNARKGISARPALTVHSSPEWSRTHAAEPDTRVAEVLLDLVRPWLGDAVARDVTVRRWAYSRPNPVHDERAVVCLFGGARLVCCGDAFGEPRVEGATLSGVAAADAVLAS